MIFRAMLVVIATCAAAVAAGDVPAETAAARAARYYAAGLELPLLHLRRGVLLLQACTARLRSACTKEQRALAARNHTVALLDELTLFPQRPDSDPSAGIQRAADLKERISATSDALLRDANAYDREILVRYGAALDTCPGDYEVERYERLLDVLTSVELRRFQGVAEPDYAAVFSAMENDRKLEAATLRALPAEDCAAILAVGHLLMELMDSKLQPWTRAEQRVANPGREFDFDTALKPPPDDAPAPGLAHSITGNFITVVATELQLKAFPETAPRIKAIAESEGHDSAH
jgi:hypothetical protein